MKMAKSIRIALLIVLDIIIINVAYIGSYLLRFEFEVNSTQFEIWFAVYASNIVPITLITLLSFGVLGIYTSMWRYAGTQELVKVVIAALASEFLVLGYMTFTQQAVPRSIYIISGLLIIVLVGGSRIAYRMVRSIRSPGAFNSTVFSMGRRNLMGGNVSKVMIIGAGDAGASMIREMKQHPEYGKKPVVVIDDNPSKIGSRINGVKVVGDVSNIRPIVRKYGITEIIVAIPSANRKVIQEIVNECNKTRAKIKILPSLIDLINETVSISKLRDVDIEDLLGENR